MPTDFQLKTMNAIHRGLLKISGGHFGWNVANMPVLELTTTGRKSGQARTVMLTSPIQDGPDDRRRGVARWRRPTSGLVPQPPRPPRGRRS